MTFLNNNNKKRQFYIKINIVSGVLFPASYIKTLVPKWYVKCQQTPYLQIEKKCLFLNVSILLFGKKLS